MSYERVSEHEERPRAIRDWTAKWEALTPLRDLDDRLLARVREFCTAKNITVEALEELGTRIAVRRGGRVCLAWAGDNGNGTVTAIKLRPLDASSHETVAEAPSVWLRPIVAGRRDSLHWLIAEGETDAARLLGLVGTDAAVLVLPAGALTFKPEWADVIPRGARIYIAHDADDQGDRGAEKARSVIGGRTVRLRPPEGVKDWSSWEGGRAEFIQLVREARGQSEVGGVRFASLDAFVDTEEEGGEAVLGTADNAVASENSDVMVYGDGGAGKTTLCADLGCHLAAGDTWLGIPVPRPLRVVIIENEGPRPRFRRKLRRKRDAWAGAPLGGRISVLEMPWGAFTFAAEGWRELLADHVRENAVDVVICGPVVSAGMEAAGTLQEVRGFLDLVADVRRRSGRPLVVILVHHENKGGKVSGAWEGAGDTLLHVSAQGHGRMRLHFQKTRWAPDYHGTTLHLLWAEGDGFEVEEKEELDDEAVAELILAAIRKSPGVPWSAVEDETRGVGDDRRRAVRDSLFAAGKIVNVVTEAGAEVALDHCPPRRRSRLFPTNDPTIRNLERSSAAGAPQTAAPGGNDPRPYLERGARP
jgi:hypothetical protein